jgi:carbohydrate diacid regulator
VKLNTPIGPVLDPDARVFAAADLRVPQLVAATVGQERSEYAASVLGGLRDRADWPTLRETLIAWSEGGFNLLRLAERLHVHRNTLLYRLGKIEQLSARQMREAQAGDRHVPDRPGRPAGLTPREDPHHVLNGP